MDCKITTFPRHSPSPLTKFMKKVWMKIIPLHLGGVCLIVKKKKIDAKICLSQK